jgi:hypothetical protein
MFTADGTIGTQSTVTQSAIRAEISADEFFNDEATHAR